MVGLKRIERIKIDADQLFAFNRTMVGLKRRYTRDCDPCFSSFNRTMVGLKRNLIC